MTSEEIFRERVRALRNERGINQKQVAEGLGITEAGYQNYEVGRRRPTFGVFIDLADFFKVSLDVGSSPPNTFAMAFVSIGSPTGVDVPCVFIYPISSGFMPAFLMP